ncbi:hypothetical protein [Sphingomonas sp. ERG5]|uniref:hypothetical protein n=1 Tax=Sphingomonas sp. ERG5 TaxID=1381597 RepID=UPI00126A27B7|nr:hypothetical protein [Sphingomonas sp. ERG5]
MKIDTIYGENNARVVAHYKLNGVTNYLVIPYEGYGGLNVILEHECSIVDNDAEWFVPTTHGAAEEAFVDIAAFDNDLLISMIEHDSEAMEKFFDRLKERGGFP